MNIDEIKELHELRGLCYKGDFLQNLSNDEFNEGLIKFEMLDDGSEEGINIYERIWGWAAKEEKEKYMDDSFRGDINVILANNPLNFSGILFWGTELAVTCDGGRPVLSTEWLQENILSKDWYR